MNTETIQKLCLLCGLCCDGTLFSSAQLKPVENDELLLSRGFIPGRQDGRRGFILPCPHHQGRACDIYGEWRPAVCAHFFCKLIKQAAAGTLTEDQAQEQIQKTTALRDEVRAKLRNGNGSQPLSLAILYLAWAEQHDVNQLNAADQAISLQYAALRYRLDLYFIEETSPQSGMLTSPAAEK